MNWKISEFLPNSVHKNFIVRMVKVFISVFYIVF
jgi:hypothetical protein